MNLYRRKRMLEPLRSRLAEHRRHSLCLVLGTSGDDLDSAQAVAVVEVDDLARADFVGAGLHRVHHFLRLSLQTIKPFGKCKPIMHKRNRKSVSSTLKQAIKHSSMTRAAISRKTGISESSLCHFMAGKHKLSLDAVDALAKFFGLGLAVEWNESQANRTKGPRK